MGAKKLGMLLAFVIVGCFSIGFFSHRTDTSAGTATASAEVAPPRVSSTPLAPIGVRHIPAAHPKLPRPPLPEHDPGLVQWLQSGVEVTPEGLAGRIDEIDRRLEELFGADFPADKRKKVFAAQEQWLRAHAHAVFSYYDGEISQDELTNAVHQNMIAWSQGVAAALSTDEYRRFADLEPGVDPWTVLANPDQKAGDELETADPAAGPH